MMKSRAQTLHPTAQTSNKKMSPFQGDEEQRDGRGSNEKYEKYGTKNIDYRFKFPNPTPATQVLPLKRGDHTIK